MYRAKRSPAGKGREEPNNDPNLPPPLGRLQWSWNPFTMFNQLLGRGFRCKIYCLCISCYLIYTVIYIGPGLLSRLVTWAIFGT